MSQTSNIERYAKDPSLLIELCRDVIDRLDTGSNNDDTAAMEAQLREIAKTIEKLEKMGVPVPDALRGEKTRLAAALSITAEDARALQQLIDEFEDLLKDLRSRLNVNTVPADGKPIRRKRSNSPKTDPQTLRAHIIAALRNLGGRGRVADVLDEIGKQLEGKLLPGDLEIRQDGKTLAWRNNAQWERLRMVHDGTLRSDSSNGYWELNT